MKKEGRGKKISREIERKERRKIYARKHKDRILWFGLGTFGLIGWSVMVPTVIGLAIGIWIDKAYPSKFSWTIMLLLLGVFIGCIMAWVWVARERKSIEKERKDNQDEK
ncbi:MAG: AtpZ/AtpI family protein [Simkaniaceae bacterium]